MATYRYNSIKFDRNNLRGLDADCVKGLTAFMAARERVLNTIETTSIMYTEGPFEGQIVELCNESPGMLPLDFNGWKGFYKLGKWTGTTGKKMAIPDSAGQLTKSKEIGTGKGFEQLGDLLSQLGECPDEFMKETTIRKSGFAVSGLVDDFGFSIEPQKRELLMDDFGDFFIPYSHRVTEYSYSVPVVRAVYTMGRLTYKIKNSAKSIDRLRAAILAKKKWFADKFIQRSDNLKIVEQEELAKRKATFESQATQDVAQVIADAVATIAISEAMQPSEAGELVTCEAGESEAQGVTVGSASGATWAPIPQFIPCPPDKIGFNNGPLPAFRGGDGGADTPPPAEFLGDDTPPAVGFLPVMYEIAYSYPSSDHAKKCGFTDSGCFVVSIKNEITGFAALEDAENFASMSGLKPGRWSIDHPDNKHLKARSEVPAHIVPTAPLPGYGQDGKCHNAQHGTYGHECGKPATWIGTTATGFKSGFCSECKESGHEARGIVHWTAIPPVAVLTPPVAVREYPSAAIEKRGVTDFWVCGVDGWQVVGGGQNVPGYASEASAKIAIRANGWKARNAEIVPFRYSDGGLHGCSPCAAVKTRFAVLVHSAVEIEPTPPAVESQPDYEQKAAPAGVSIALVTTGNIAAPPVVESKPNSEGERIRAAADRIRAQFPAIAAEYDDLAASHDLKDEREARTGVNELSEQNLINAGVHPIAAEIVERDGLSGFGAMAQAEILAKLESAKQDQDVPKIDANEWEPAIGERYIGSVEYAVQEANKRGDGFEYRTGEDALMERRKNTAPTLETSMGQQVIGKSGNWSALLFRDLDGKPCMIFENAGGKFDPIAFTSNGSRMKALQTLARAADAPTDTPPGGGLPDPITTAAEKADRGREYWAAMPEQARICTLKAIGWKGRHIDSCTINMDLKESMNGCHDDTAYKIASLVEGSANPVASVTPTPTVAVRRNIIPDNGLHIVDDAFEAWTFTSGARFAFVMYLGKSAKPWKYYGCPTEAKRDDGFSRHAQDARSIALSKATRKAESKAQADKPHGLQVGDVVRSSWGYEQTNVNHYQIVKVIGKRTVEVRALAEHEETTGDMTGRLAPVHGEFVGEVMRRQVDSLGQVNIRHADYGRASKIEPLAIVHGVRCYAASSYSSYA